MKKKYIELIVEVLIILLILAGLFNFYRIKNIEEENEMINLYKKNFINTVNLVNQGIYSGYMQWDYFFTSIINEEEYKLLPYFSDIKKIFKYIKSLETVHMDNKNINNYQIDYKNGLYTYFNVSDSLKNKIITGVVIKAEIDYNKIINDIKNDNEYVFGSKGKDFFMGIKYQSLKPVFGISDIIIITIIESFFILLIFYIRQRRKNDSDLGIKLEKLISILFKINSDNEKEFLKEVFNAVFDFVPEASLGSISYFEGEKWVFLDTRGYDTEKLNKLNLKVEYALKPDSISFLKDINKKNKEILDIEVYEKFKKLSRDIKDTMFIPFKTENKHYGFITLDIESKSKDSFTKDTFELMSAFYNIISIYFTIKELGQMDNKFREKIISSIIQLLEIHDNYTKGHSQSVAEYSSKFAEYLGLTEKEVNDVFWAGLVHDIGKIVIPSEILNKSDKLTDEEYEQIKMHPTYGYYVLVQNSELENIARIILHHHERYDGHGYPQNLKGEQIPLLSQIVAIVDTFDALTSNRAYRKKQKTELALEEIERCAGTQFNRDLALKFIDFYTDLQ